MNANMETARTNMQRVIDGDITLSDEQANRINGYSRVLKKMTQKVAESQFDLMHTAGMVAFVRSTQGNDTDLSPVYLEMKHTLTCREHCLLCANDALNAINTEFENLDTNSNTPTDNNTNTTNNTVTTLSTTKNQTLNATNPNNAGIITQNQNNNIVSGQNADNANRSTLNQPHTTTQNTINNQTSTRVNKPVVNRVVKSQPSIDPQAQKVRKPFEEDNKTTNTTLSFNTPAPKTQEAEVQTLNNAPLATFDKDEAKTTKTAE